MPVVENINPLLIIAAFTGLISLYYLVSLLSQVKRVRVFASIRRLGSFLLFFMITSTISVIVIGTIGYQALVREESVARIVVSPLAEQRFNARLLFPDGSQQVFALKGDELLVDAYVLKWKPWTNILGLHTAYRLERVVGRYRSIEDESSKERTVFAISNKTGEGVAQWREDFKVLSFLLDVEHGSASFVNADEKKSYQLMITTDGLLIRPDEDSST